MHFILHQYYCEVLEKLVHYGLVRTCEQCHIAIKHDKVQKCIKRKEENWDIQATFIAKVFCVGYSLTHEDTPDASHIY